MTTTLKWSIPERFSAKLEEGHLRLVFRTATNGTFFIKIPLDAVSVQTEDLPTAINNRGGFVLVYTDKQAQRFQLVVSSGPNMQTELDDVKTALRETLFEVFSGETLEE